MTLSFPSFFQETSFSSSIHPSEFCTFELEGHFLSGIFLSSFKHRDGAVSACEMFVSAVIVNQRFIIVSKADD